MKKLILIGAGGRGITYTDIAASMPDEFKVVAVAEPRESRREYIKEKHGISSDMCFNDYHELLAKPKLADTALICTLDRMHLEPALAAIEKGYDIVLEKPISVSAKDCEQLLKAANRHGTSVLVCFVLRYTNFFRTIKKLIECGKVGEVMNIQHAECVWNVHQSHSFVRGDWHSEEETTFMLLAKSCHDIDIMQWLIGKEAKKVQSFGSLSYFKRENAPSGSPMRCIEGCPVGDTCPYNAVNLYLSHDKRNWFRAWFTEAATKKVDPTDEDVINALKTTNYGKCVFKCDNDVVDHQVVNIEYEGGAVASFTMSAFNKGGRTIRVMGTNGEIYGDMDSGEITYYSFQTRETERVELESKDKGNTVVDGHGGGDRGLMVELAEILNTKNRELCDFENAVLNHITAFAAEESRLNGTVVDIDEYRKRIL